MTRLIRHDDLRTPTLLRVCLNDYQQRDSNVAIDNLVYSYLKFSRVIHLPNPLSIDGVDDGRAATACNRETILPIRRGKETRSTDVFSARAFNLPIRDRTQKYDTEKESSKTPFVNLPSNHLCYTGSLGVGTLRTFAPHSRTLLHSTS